MFVWCELPASINTTELLVQSVQHQVAFVPGEYFYVKQAKSNTLRLSFATTPPEKINAAVKVLGKLIAERLASTSDQQELISELQ
jgi:2-aminoadipate transaminase